MLKTTHVTPWCTAYALGPSMNTGLGCLGLLRPASPTLVLPWQVAQGVTARCVQVHVRQLPNKA